MSDENNELLDNPNPGLALVEKKVETRGGAREGSGPKPKPINMEDLEKLAMMQCSSAEIGAFFKVTERCIEKRIKKDPAFAEIIQRGKETGKISVRRAQMKLLEAGNPTMAIWLGKQILGQRDIAPIDIEEPNGARVQLSLQAIDAILTTARQRQRARAS